MAINIAYYQPTIAAQNRKRRKEELDHVRRLNAAWKAPKLDFKRLAKIDKKLASGDKRQILEGMREMLKLAQDHRDQCDAARITAEQQEAREQAVARGEVIDISHIKRLRLASRDGLEYLKNHGAITDEQFAAGMRYRDIYDRADWERKLKPLDPGRIGSPHHGGEGYADKRAEWFAELAQVEAKIITRTQHAYALCMIQEVAGSRRSIRSMHGGGAYRVKQIEGLRLALDVCVEHFGVR